MKANIMTTNDPQRIARMHVLNGQPIPCTVQAQLEARGIDVGDLHTRLLASQEYRS